MGQATPHNKLEKLPQEAKDSTEIENIITTQDQLYKALSTSQTQPSKVKEVVNYRKAIFTGYDLIKKQGFLNLLDLVQKAAKLYLKAYKYNLKT